MRFREILQGHTFSGKISTWAPIFKLRGSLLHSCYLSTWFSHWATVWLMGRALGTQLNWSDMVFTLKGLVTPQEEDSQKKTAGKQDYDLEGPTCQLSHYHWGAGNSSQGCFQITKVPTFFQSRKMVISLQCFTRSMLVHRGQSSEHTQTISHWLRDTVGNIHSWNMALCLLFKFSAHSVRPSGTLLIYNSILLLIYHGFKN